MIKRSFLGIIEPVLEYEQLGTSPPEPEQTKPPGEAVIIVGIPFDTKKRARLQVGDTVSTGQKILLYEGCDIYATAPVTGTILSINAYTGHLGQLGTKIRIEAGINDTFDPVFAEFKDTPSIENAREYLQNIPGKPALEKLLESGTPAKAIIICVSECDLLSVTRQYAATSLADAINSGIRILKKISSGSKIIMAVPENMNVMGKYPDIETISINAKYPASLPHIISKDHLNTVIPQEKTCEDMGIFFFSAESVAAMGTAYEKGQIPIEKIITIVNKDGEKKIIKARIGTPIGDIFKTLKIFANERDRIVIDGPMTGYSAYTLDHPVQPETDSIIIQDRDSVETSSDYPCTNCGKCIRICPANVPVNLLVRLLEANEFEEAADNYDLHSCIGCGLCSYVCVSKIPIFQYIRVAKHELALMELENAAEDNNG